MILKVQMIQKIVKNSQPKKMKMNINFQKLFEKIDEKMNIFDYYLNENIKLILYFLYYIFQNYNCCFSSFSSSHYFDVCRVWIIILFLIKKNY